MSFTKERIQKSCDVNLMIFLLLAHRNKCFVFIVKDNNDSLLKCTQNFFSGFLKRLGSLDWFLGLHID